jgi:hypothetical protein
MPSVTLFLTFLRARCAAVTAGFVIIRMPVSVCNTETGCLEGEVNNGDPDHGINTRFPGCGSSPATFVP